MQIIKDELKSELGAQQRRELTLKGTIPRVTTAIKEIFEELAKSGDDGEKLAAAFRKTEGNSNVIRVLRRAQKEGNLVEKAREILIEGTQPVEEEDQEEENEKKITRVCWCWLQT